MWFDSFSDLVRVLLVGGAAYITVVVLLRTTGKRTLAKLNAFDLVVTVALGSTLATILLSQSVSWTEGALALALLAVLQTAVAWVTTRRPGLRAVVTARPRLVLRDGEPLHDAMRAERISLDEIRQAVRSSGTGDLSSVAAVVLESDGSLSILSAQQYGDGSALSGVEGVGR
ncbi:DUF421 domain-containing protein [Blastococcus saxobsidens]|uniref:DUF421 domain-containing protein n=1 Tax=Blastococcus saxobsidens (strain DD2) TaxID=1146883 RepID=H6RMK0_BLASD|nr:YetF domain-containing protein [Blastococcus saxobsidens]CCG03835.1 conserved membrane protein of unknown function [Blastococcus saxobsidens DD2]